ncbi:uncharacterized protein LACBIDRAFT_300519 [Laccaria bicolor S238N-H82]|uniref:Predicted protein n=1 Tax=Laccaria bicolor (strain S238N-H82 / ATCC MYA-4686) TaxID=486041 RepID=B0DGY5_LACBS|nr:uncharacterized protein LACBIDRAFT_300519 [Laccaria bicolor S238N-H82]EDR06231.1 predicted protein [Laccaria bicolor S238N-H82]|eukprot:XP_001883092.1 predicted protein [Laccaria bicolor S238N-H82]
MQRMVPITRKLSTGRPSHHIPAIPIFITAWRISLVWHNILVLPTVLAVYCYRDVWPLANYGKTPIDVKGGKLLWAKLAILTITADSMENPSPEQTCCLMPMMFYSFVDPIIGIAAKVPHLSYNDLPPQPYCDRSKHLIKCGFRIGCMVFDGTFRDLISFPAC